MTFYKMYNIQSGNDIYINVDAIDYFTYHYDKVEIHLEPNVRFYVDKTDFANMMIKELGNDDIDHYISINSRGDGKSFFANMMIKELGEEK